MDGLICSNLKLVVKTRSSAAFSVNANSTGSVQISVTTSDNLKPIGIVGIKGTNTTALCYSDYYLENETTAKVYYKNTASTDKSGVVLQLVVLYEA